MYMEFCRGVERDPFPASEDSLCLFVANMFLDGLSAGIVKSYLAAIQLQKEWETQTESRCIS